MKVFPSNVLSYMICNCVQINYLVFAIRSSYCSFSTAFQFSILNSYQGKLLVYDFNKPIFVNITYYSYNMQILYSLILCLCNHYVCKIHNYFYPVFTCDFICCLFISIETYSVTRWVCEFVIDVCTYNYNMYSDNVVITNINII